MKWIRERVLRGELLAGTFLNLGSSLTAEIAGRAGLDWVVIGCFRHRVLLGRQLRSPDVHNDQDRAAGEH